MGYLIKADHTGHGNVVNWGKDAASIKAGREAFDALTAQGYSMFAMDSAEPRKLKAFEEDTNAIAIRALQGG